MREMKESGVNWIGQIPADWNVIRMKTAISKRDGGAWGAEPQENENDYICIRVADFDYERMTIKQVNDYEFTRRNYDTSVVERLILKKGNILIEKSGGGEKTPVGRTVIFNENNPCLYANFIDRLIVAENMLPKYLQYVLVTFYKNEYVRKYIKQTTGIQNLDITTMLSQEKITCPTLEAQHRIADFLDDKCAKIDAIIARQREVIEKLKAYKLSVITEAVTKGINPSVPMKDSGIEWIGEIPAHWSTGNLKYFVTKIGSGKTPRGGSEVYTNEGVLFLRSQNIYETGLILDETTFITNEIDEEMKNTRVYKNDVLLNITGGSIGRCCIYKDEEYANVNQHVCIIRLKENELISAFVFFFIISCCGKNSINIYQGGANREGLNFEQIGNTKIPYLPINEQLKVIDYLDRKCEKLEVILKKKFTLIERLDEYKKSLIYEVVTGKKEV